MSITRAKNRVETLLDLVRKRGLSDAEKLEALRGELENIRADLLDAEADYPEPEDVSEDKEDYEKIYAVVEKSDPELIKAYYDQAYFDSLKVRTQGLLARALLAYCKEREITPLKIWITYAS